MRSKSVLLKAILIIIVVLYVSFLYMDISDVKFSISPDLVKYASIVLCFFISFFGGDDVLSKRDIFLLRAGLLLTVIADLFLLVFQYFTLGVSVFSVVQIIYSIRYDAGSVYSILRNYLIIFLCIIASYLIVNFYIIKIEFLYAIALFYAFGLVINVVKAIKASKNGLFPSPNKYMIVLGMILFLLCDINVGLFNTIAQQFSNTSYVLIWFFYLPSQVLLS
ncbi:MAG TPA: hypothetical protein DD434_02615, partial [Bacteroidales bacterium]|nr:hypothetical protein [Bacteroidales bacterium]